MMRLAALVAGLLLCASPLAAQQISTPAATTSPGGSSGNVQTNNGSGGFSGIATTGSGSAVLATSPTLVTPVLGAAAATSLAVNGCSLSGSTVCTNGGLSTGYAYASQTTANKCVYHLFGTTNYGCLGGVIDGHTWALGSTSALIGTNAPIITWTDNGPITLAPFNKIVNVNGATQATGSVPTLSGTCTTGSQVGGNTAGSFTATCTAQTVIITFAGTASNGYVCTARDETTAADVLNQTAHSTTSCTLTGTTVASDVIVFEARAF